VTCTYFCLDFIDLILFLCLVGSNIMSETAYPIMRIGAIEDGVVDECVRFPCRRALVFQAGQPVKQNFTGLVHRHDSVLNGHGDWFAAQSDSATSTTSCVSCSGMTRLCKRL
jgi:hypothetical protein